MPVAAQHHQQNAQRINYHDLPVGDSRAEHGDTASADAALEADLASFAAALQAHRDAQLPGQLDLTDALNNAGDDEQETA